MIVGTRGSNVEDAADKKNKTLKITFLDAMLRPSADFGGLYTFDYIPKFSDSELKYIFSLDYIDMSHKVFEKLNINIDKEILKEALQTYKNFDSYKNNNCVVPLVELSKNLFCAELYHGPTSAFKDMALQPFSVLLDKIAGIRNEKYLILSATSGDTGPATLEGFSKAKNIKTICIYPENGTSEVQKLQMTTQDSKNIKVFAIKGNFDDAQSELKALINNQDFIKSLQNSGYSISVANSINIARIAFQIVYYFDIASKINNALKANKNTPFDVVVPSGNFGNALGAFFAKNMGVNINKIKIASNPNDILYLFFSTGIYDLREKVLLSTYSPAMDILKSSNIERILYFYLGSARTKELMDSLNNNNFFQLTKEELFIIQDTFISNSSSDSDCLKGIEDCLSENNYIIDPHTSNAYLFAKNSACDIAQVIISTASFAKFIPTMLKAFKLDSLPLNDKDGLASLQASFSPKIKGNYVSKNILDLFDKEEIHTQVYDKSELKSEILKWVCVG